MNAQGTFNEGRAVVRTAANDPRAAGAPSKRFTIYPLSPVWHDIPQAERMYVIDEMISSARRSGGARHGYSDDQLGLRIDAHLCIASQAAQTLLWDPQSTHAQDVPGVDNRLPEDWDDTGLFCPPVRAVLRSPRSLFPKFFTYLHRRAVVLLVECGLRRIAAWRNVADFRPLAQVVLERKGYQLVHGHQVPRAYLAAVLYARSGLQRRAAR